MVLIYLAILAAAYLLLLFWIVFAVQETTRKHMPLPETRHISVKKGKRRKYVVRFE